MSTVYLSIDCYPGAQRPPEVLIDMIRTILNKYNTGLNPNQRKHLLDWCKKKHVSAFFGEHKWEFPNTLSMVEYISIQNYMFKELDIYHKNRIVRYGSIEKIES